MNDYSIWVIEYARAPVFPRNVFLTGHEGDAVLPYSVTLLQSDEQTILVDCGYVYEGNKRALADANGNKLWVPPHEMLGRIGLDPVDIDALILTHVHFDHAGDLAPFENATVYLQRRELEKWIWAFAQPRQLGWLRTGVDPDDLHALLRIAAQGRLVLVDEEPYTVAPGVTLHSSHNTHTYGHQHVLVETRTNGRWVAPGDAIYVYENVEGIDGSGVYVPIGFATGASETAILTMDRIMQLVDHDSQRLLLGHEARLWERHPSAEYPDGLHVVEACIRNGDHTRLAAPAADLDR